MSWHINSDCKSFLLHLRYFFRFVSFFVFSFLKFVLLVFLISETATNHLILRLLETDDGWTVSKYLTLLPVSDLPHSLWPPAPAWVTSLFYSHSLHIYPLLHLKTLKHWKDDFLSLLKHPHFSRQLVSCSQWELNTTTKTNWIKFITKVVKEEELYILARWSEGRKNTSHEFWHHLQTSNLSEC